MVWINSCFIFFGNMNFLLSSWRSTEITLVYLNAHLFDNYKGLCNWHWFKLFVWGLVIIINRLNQGGSSVVQNYRWFAYLLAFVNTIYFWILQIVIIYFWTDVVLNNGCALMCSMFFFHGLRNYKYCSDSNIIKC